MPSVDRPQRLIIALAALVAFAPLSIDTYLPSLPLIASELASRADEVQLTISLFLAGLCLSPEERLSLSGGKSTTPRRPAGSMSPRQILSGQRNTGGNCDAEELSSSSARQRTQAWDTRMDRENAMIAEKSLNMV